MRLGLVLLLAAAWTLGGAASASYPGTNGKIGFVRFDDGFDIYSVNPNGSDLDRLTGARSDYEPTWSPDGSMVAFDRIVSGRYQVFTMDADGSNRTQITSGEADNLWSTWSPDGLTIAFTRYRDQDGDDEIYSMNLDGTGLTRLTRNRVTDLHAAWSPDGETIAFNRERRGRTNLWVTDADGSNPINLTPGPTDGGAARRLRQGHRGRAPAPRARRAAAGPRAASGGTSARRHEPRVARTRRRGPRAPRSRHRTLRPAAAGLGSPAPRRQPRGRAVHDVGVRALVDWASRPGDRAWCGRFAHRGGTSAPVQRRVRALPRGLPRRVAQGLVEHARASVAGPGHRRGARLPGVEGVGAHLPRCVGSGAGPAGRGHGAQRPGHRSLPGPDDAARLLANAAVGARAGVRDRRPVRGRSRTRRPGDRSDAGPRQRPVPPTAVGQGRPPPAASGAAEARGSFRDAFESAEAAGARMWQLRAATRLTELRSASGEPADEERATLRAIYETFAQESDTADIVDARLALGDAGH